MPTQQQTFDTVVAHLRKQGRKAANDTGTCLYRAPNGDRCAAGCLVADEDYIEEWEGNIVATFNGCAPLLEPNPVGQYLLDLGHDLELVYELQSIHDKHDPEDWEEKWQTLARRYNLEFPFPQTAPV